jgi:hypothetical protein
MPSDILTKNLARPLFERHTRTYTGGDELAWKRKPAGGLKRLGGENPTWGSVELSVFGNSQQSCCLGSLSGTMC